MRHGRTEVLPSAATHAASPPAVTLRLVALQLIRPIVSRPGGEAGDRAGHRTPDSPASQIPLPGGGPMAHPAIPAPAAGHRHHRGLPPGGIPASVMPGDADGALAA